MANPGSLASMMFEIEESEDSLSESEFEGGGFEETIDTPTTIPSIGTSIPALVLSTSVSDPKHCEWSNAEMQYLLDLLCERIVESGWQSIRAKDWEAMQIWLIEHFHWRLVIKGCI